MLLLNVSDIHFRYPHCNTPMDPDRPYRTMLIQDARNLSAQLGPVEAILVSGDIAYAGRSEEYQAAYAWLTELAAACGCPLRRVFVIPGNHDVNRRIVLENPSVRNVHSAITRAETKHREGELFNQFRHPETGRSLLAPIDAYNEFAARFDCQVYSPEKLFWQQDLPLDDRVILRIYGLTSTLLSGAEGRDDNPQSLYLSPLQTALDPADGVVNVVMCHHPPDWFMDSDNVEDAVRGRASIHFFGHKHRQRLMRDLDYIRFSAGAVNPDRNEIGWEPGYNLVKLTVIDENGTRFLNIAAHLRVWQTNPDMFRAKNDSSGNGVFTHRLQIRGVLPKKPADAASTAGAPMSVSADAAVIKGVTDLEATMGNERTRDLVLRFWNLASSERREIALKLGIIDPEEIRQLSEPERYGRALRRAGERGLLDRLTEEIEKREAN